MRKLWLIGLLLLMFTGCGAQETLGTLGDVYVEPVSAPLQQIVVSLPLDATVTAMTIEAEGSLYLCDGYTICVQTLSAGDLDKTLRTITGYGKDTLRLLESFRGDAKRYDCVWTAAGEGEDQVGRACILDDGNFHYVVSVMAGQSQSGRLEPVWRDIFDSFRLADPSVEFNTGS